MKIKNKSDLEKEIYRLQLEVQQKEQDIQVRFDALSDQLEPGVLLNTAVKSFFHQQTKNKTLVTTTLTILAGFIVERVILRKSSILVKYGIAQLAMGLVSRLAEQNWYPEVINKIKNALQQAIDAEINKEEDSDNDR
jgi:hypothetical protein